MKIKKYIEYIRENYSLDIEELEENFLFLHDLELEYEVESHWLPTFKKYADGNYFDYDDGFPGEERLFIFNHEYRRGFNLQIRGKVDKNELRNFYVNIATTFNWLKQEGYGYNHLSNIDPDIIVDFMSNIEGLNTTADYIDYNKKYNNYNEIHIVTTAGNFFGFVHLFIDLFFEGPEIYKPTAKEMAEKYDWSYQKLDDNGRDVWIKVNNEKLLDNILGTKNDWYDILSSEDIDWSLYNYHLPDYDMMGSYSSKNIIDKLKLILNSEERYDSKLWKGFKEIYPNEYDECCEILGTIYMDETAIQQKEDVKNSWEKYLNQYFSITSVDDEENQWLIKVDNKWFNYYGIDDYSGFHDVLDHYFNNDYFSSFEPYYREYPNINNKLVEDEWLPILNRILENKK